MKKKRKRMMDVIPAQRVHYDPIIHNMADYYTDDDDSPDVRDTRATKLHSTMPMYNHHQSMYDYGATTRNNGVHTYILALPMALDIECTNVTKSTIAYDDTVGMHVDYTSSRGYMYHWQLAIRNHVYLGRTWNQLDYLLTAIAAHYDLGSHGDRANIAIIYIANLAYEFAFLAHRLPIHDVFADRPRKPMRVSVADNFELRDALRLSGGSLDYLANNYCTTPKLRGELDYTIPRNTDTPLAPAEIAYCVNDVIILAEYAAYVYNTYMRQCGRVPLTKTGIPRACMRDMYADWMPTRKIQRAKWLRSMMPQSYAEYHRVVTQLYRGGYTHANVYYVNDVIEDVMGADITSSYPAVLMQCRMPMAPFTRVDDVHTDTDLARYHTKYPYYARCKFTGVRSRTMHSVESVDKIAEYDDCGKSPAELIRRYNAIIDNGRVRSIDQMTVMLTDLDMAIYRKYYIWDSVEVSDVMVSRYAPLPTYVTDVVRYYYRAKSLLKRMGKSGTPEYAAAKEAVNAIYGLMVQRLQFVDHRYNADTGTWYDYDNIDGDNADAVYWHLIGYDDDKVISGDKSPKTVLTPYWGVWCTAWARYRLLCGVVYPMHGIAIYCDTDSVYVDTMRVDDYDRMQQVISTYNDTIRGANARIFGDDDTYADLGCLDMIIDDADTPRPGHYRFATLGAKRYVKCDYAGNYITTIAGLDKSALTKFADYVNGVIMRANDILCTAPPDSDATYSAVKSIYDVYPVGLTPRKIDSIIYDTVTPMDIFLAGWMDIPVRFAQRLTPIYADDAYSDDITDADGHTVKMVEKSGVALVATSYTMTVRDWYLALAAQLRADGLGDNRAGEFGGD